MARLRLCVPDGTLNYITNPSMRYDTSDWNAQGATVTRTLARVRFGVASLQVVTDGAALHEGAYFRVSALDGISDTLTVSAYVRGTGVARIRLDDNAIGGREYAGDPVVLSDIRWTRLTVSGRCHGGDDLRLYVETAEGAAAARTFYVDGAQMERKPYPTTYCDGEQPGCFWAGIHHDSNSQRRASTREGGRWVEISGPDREAEDLYMTTAGGLGMAPLRNNTQTFAQAPGGFQQNAKVDMRVMTFAFHARYKKFFRDIPASLVRLHELRQLLIDVIKPDRTGGDEAIWFEYTDGDIPLYFRARYDGGLEGDWDVRQGNVNSFPLRLLAEDPFFREDTQDASLIDFQESIEVNYVAARIDGRWTNMNYGFDRYPYEATFGPRRKLYVVGDSNMTVANNDTDAIDPQIAIGGRASWNGEKWEALGGAALSAISNIFAIAVGLNGYIYVGGDFTSIGGVSAARIAYWDGSAWNAMGSGVNGDVYAIVVASNGDIYVGGALTTAGGLTVNRVARWDGSSWHRLGQYQGLNAIVRSLALSRDGSSILYVGGDFTDENGNPGSGLNHVAQYSTLTGQFSAMGNGFDDSVNAMAVNAANELFVSGIFSLSGSESMNSVAVWQGSAWKSLGTGLLNVNGIANGSSDDLALFSDQRLIVTGTFAFAGGIPVENVAVWNGYTWTHLDAHIDTSLNKMVRVDPDTDDIFLGLDQSAAGQQLIFSGRTTIHNMGSRACNPVFYVKGPGTLKYIENHRTMKRMYFDLPINENEEILIDTGRGRLTSSHGRNVMQTLLDGSDFHNFLILPGDNDLLCFIDNDVDAQMSVQMPIQHWSADAGGRGEEL